MAAIILNGGGASEAADFAAWDVHYERWILRQQTAYNKHREEARKAEKIICQIFCILKQVQEAVIDHDRLSLAWQDLLKLVSSEDDDQATLPCLVEVGPLSTTHYAMRAKTCNQVLAALQRLLATYLCGNDICGQTEITDMITAYVKFVTDDIDLECLKIEGVVAEKNFVVVESATVIGQELDDSQ